MGTGVIMRLGSPARRAAPGLVSIIVPTRNEAENVVELVERVHSALTASETEYEVVFVDDSDDGTAEVIESLAATVPVRLLHRPLGERAGGLSGAVLAGFAIACGEVLVVMDADLQHPPERLPDVVSPLLDGYDVAVATRYAPGGGNSGLGRGVAGVWRRAVSRGARRAAHITLPRIRGVSDPLGGYFAVRREVVDGVALRPTGFKILLEILARGRWSTVVEIPYRFSERAGGESKAGMAEGLRFGRHLLRLAADCRRPHPRVQRETSRGSVARLGYPALEVVVSAPSAGSPGPMSNEQPA